MTPADWIFYLPRILLSLIIFGHSHTCTHARTHTERICSIQIMLHICVIAKLTTWYWITSWGLSTGEEYCFISLHSLVTCSLYHLWNPIGVTHSTFKCLLVLSLYSHVLRLPRRSFPYISRKHNLSVDLIFPSISSQHIETIRENYSLSKCRELLIMWYPGSDMWT